MSGKELKPIKTPWGPPWEHRILCTRMDALLRRLGVEDPARTRLHALAYQASGWRQNVWHFNAWGTKRGSWPGEWYTLSTWEDDGSGNMIPVKAAEWRAFTGWAEALVDTWERLTRHPRYAARSGVALVSRHMSDDDFFKALGLDGYYTDTTKPPTYFSGITSKIRRELAAATPAELAAAEMWAAGAVEIAGGEVEGAPFDPFFLTLPGWAWMMMLVVALAGVTAVIALSRRSS